MAVGVHDRGDGAQRVDNHPEDAVPQVFGHRTSASALDVQNQSVHVPLAAVDRVVLSLRRASGTVVAMVLQSAYCTEHEFSVTRSPIWQYIYRVLLVRHVCQVHKHVLDIAGTLSVAHSAETCESLPVTEFELLIINNHV